MFSLSSMVISCVRKRILLVFNTRNNNSDRPSSILLRWYGVENPIFEHSFDHESNQLYPVKVKSIAQVSNLELIRPEERITNTIKHKNKPIAPERKIMPLACPKVVRYRKIDDVLLKTNLKVENEQMYNKISRFIPGEIEQRHHNLSDLGFKNINIDDIVRYSEIVKMKRFSDNFTWDPLDVLLSQTDEPDRIKEIILEKYPTKLDANLRQLHRIVLMEYLTWKLDLENNKFLSIIKNYPSVGNRSITSLRQTIELLNSTFGFSTKKIQNNGFLLLINKENVDRLLSEKSLIGGIPVRQFVLLHPRILSFHIDRVNETENCLNEYGITQEQISACGSIFSLKPSTLRERLQCLSEICEFSNFKCKRRYLYLVYYYKKVMNRLEILKFFNTSNTVHFTLDLLITSNKLFIERLDLEGFRHRKHEIVNYLAAVFDVSPNSIFHKIDFDYFSGLSLNQNEIEKTIRFLSSRFTEEEIKDNLSVVLFDVDVVKEELTTVKKLSRTKVDMLKDLQERFYTSLKKLHLKPYKSEYVSKYGKKIVNEKDLIDKYIDSSDV